MKSLIKRLQRSLERELLHKDSVLPRQSLSRDGMWALGYSQCRIRALEDVLDELKLKENENE
jgi:hypothetical protein